MDQILSTLVTIAVNTYSMTVFKYTQVYSHYRIFSPKPWMNYSKLTELLNYNCSKIFKIKNKHTVYQIYRVR